MRRSLDNRRGLFKRLAAVAACAALGNARVDAARAQGTGGAYGLRPEPIGDGVWMFRGLDEHLSPSNGGNIANTVFFSTGAGVVVFDTGPSRLYGEEMRRAISQTVPEPVTRVVISHAHPDHYLGNQAFEGVPIEALPQTIAAIDELGGAFSDNMYRLVDRWMRGTRTVPPNQVVPLGARRLGRRELEFVPLSGHTSGDLAVLDRSGGLLLAGDLVFNGRAPTTPQANLPVWRNALERLQGLGFDRLVPGHGPVDNGTSILQTRAYLDWLEGTFAEAAAAGLTPAELAATPKPAPIAELAVVDGEFERSIAHLYDAYVLASLDKVDL